MNKKQVRSWPPIIVSAATIAALALGAVMSINKTLPTEAATATVMLQATEAAAPTGQTTDKKYIPTPTAKEATPTEAAEPAETEEYTSIIASRDWDADEGLMLMKIAMAEAEGESTEGKALVMLVVLNRVWSDEFPGTIEEVIFQPRQFSPVVQGGRYYTTEPNEDCIKALELVMSGWDESYGALYFESCAGGSWHSDNLEFLFQEGGHKFYR